MAQKTKTKKPAVKVLLLVRPRKAPDWWAVDHRGEPRWATASSSKQGEVAGFSIDASIDLRNAIDARFANDLIQSWEETYGKSYIVRVVTIQSI